MERRIPCPETQGNTSRLTRVGERTFNSNSSGNWCNGLKLKSNREWRREGIDRIQRWGPVYVHPPGLVATPPVVHRGNGCGVEPAKKVFHFLIREGFLCRYPSTSHFASEDLNAEANAGTERGTQQRHCHRKVSQCPRRTSQFFETNY